VIIVERSEGVVRRRKRSRVIRVGIVDTELKYWIGTLRIIKLREFLRGLLRTLKMVYGRGLIIVCRTGDELTVEFASYYGVKYEYCGGFGLGYRVNDLDLIVRSCDIIYCIEPYDRPLRDTRYVVSLARSLGRKVYLIRL